MAPPPTQCPHRTCRQARRMTPAPAPGKHGKKIHVPPGKQGLLCFVRTTSMRKGRKLLVTLAYTRPLPRRAAAALGGECNVERMQGPGGRCGAGRALCRGGGGDFDFRFAGRGARRRLRDQKGGSGCAAGGTRPDKAKYWNLHAKITRFRVFSRCQSQYERKD